jgi:hypothetical protein
MPPVWTERPEMVQLALYPGGPAIQNRMAAGGLNNYVTFGFRTGWSIACVSV